MHEFEKSVVVQFQSALPDLGATGSVEPVHIEHSAGFYPAVDRPCTGDRAIAICDGVIDLMAAMFSISGKQLRSPRRQRRSVARVRQIGMYVAHVTLRMRMADIAIGFGRDKSTVTHACHVIEDLREDAEFNAVVAKAEEITRVAFLLQLGGGTPHAQ